MAMIRSPACRAVSAKCALPWRPSSSASKATRRIVKSKRRPARIRASSMTTAVPVALSSAPGASGAIGHGATTESKCAPTTTTCEGAAVPGMVATMFEARRFR